MKKRKSIVAIIIWNLEGLLSSSFIIYFTIALNSSVAPASTTRLLLKANDAGTLSRKTPLMSSMVLCSTRAWNWTVSIFEFQKRLERDCSRTKHVRKNESERRKGSFQPYRSVFRRHQSDSTRAFYVSKIRLLSHILTLTSLFCNTRKMDRLAPIVIGEESQPFTKETVRRQCSQNNSISMRNLFILIPICFSMDFSMFILQNTKDISSLS